MRRTLLTLSTLTALAALSQPAQAQLTYGAQLAAQTGLQTVTVVGTTPTVADLDATYGLGGRVMFSPPIPMLSLGLVGQGVYYFPDAGSYQTFGLGTEFGLSLPVVSPYFTGGWQWRRSAPDGGTSSTENGLTLGGGLRASFSVTLFLEATVEFGGDTPVGLPAFDNNALVIQAGALFGG